MLTFALDTSGNGVDAAMLEGRELRARVCHSGREVIERLPEVFSELLSMVSAVPEDITKITVAVGPGSYTGIRTGIAFCTGLADGIGAELWGVTTLYAAACLYHHQEKVVGRVKIYIPAAQAEYYVNEYSCEGREKPDPLGAPCVVEVSEMPVASEGLCVVLDDDIRAGVSVAYGLGLAANFLGSFSSEVQQRTSEREIAACYLRGVNAKTLKERGAVPL